MEAETRAPEVPRVKLGSKKLEVSRLGLGCFQLTGLFKAPLSDEEGIAVIKQAFDRGITFFDTADRYGPHKTEILIGKALKQLPREKVRVASKFGIVKLECGVLKTNGKPECVGACCEASLDRLGVEYIDLYYQYRVGLTVRIEDNVSTELCIICFLISSYRFSKDNLEHTILHIRGANLAAKHGCNPAQPALAWLLHHRKDVVPIPGNQKFSFS
ncbi:auxin-induced protein [Musa troglodytarum]|uniref:Auxin-induced protein n=1 Tax=Musa troglodytarum TaxID=320322 RepID=A0A9E7HX42_9LILI|nr:auxin-induced protein [Musa troglodytarum]